MEVTERLCLRWADFQKHASSAFGELRRGREFSDVTLACEDGKEVEAHKIILASSSSFFKGLFERFERQNHSRPFIYLRGLKAEELEALVDFIYFGEANLLQENLEAFISVATELNVKGLDFGANRSKDNISPFSAVTFAKAEAVEDIEVVQNTREELDVENRAVGDNLVSFEVKQEFEAAGEIEGAKNSEEVDLDKDADRMEDKDTSVEGDNILKDGEGHQDKLNNRIKSMMMPSENKFGRKNEKGKICIICGKEGKINLVMKHIEVKHINALWGSCNGEMALGIVHFQDHFKQKCHFHFLIH